MHITLEIRNTGRGPCYFPSLPKATMTGEGLPNITAIREAQPHLPGPLVLPAGEGTQLEVDVQSCARARTHRYDGVRLVAPGGGTIDFVLPVYSTSVIPGLAGRDLTLPIDKRCPPRIGYVVARLE
jgi:hypothetical protein